MVKKTCPTCGKSSYSASEEGEWICPYCGEDITKVPAEPAGAEPAKLSTADIFCPADQMCP